MDDQERLWLVREAVRLLLKAIKMRRLYGPAHAYSTGALAELQTSLGGFVRRYEALRLEITREALVWDELKVYEEASRDANIAYNLYVGGARQITIRGGVTDAELGQLVGVLGAKGDEDIASLIWHCEFAHIECVCLDELTEGWSAPENLSQDGQRKIQEMNAHADRIIEALHGRATLVETGVEHEVTDSAEELEQVDKVKLDAVRGDDDGDDEGMTQVPEEAIADLRNAAIDATADKNLLLLLDIVFDGLALDAAALGDMNARWALEEIPLIAMRRANLKLLAQLLDRFKKELVALQGTTNWVGGAIVRTFEHMWSPERIEELVALAMGGQALGGPAAFTQVLRTMNAAGVAAGVSAYLKATSQEMKDALTKFLSESASLAPDEIVRLVAPEVSPEIARWALFVTSKSLKGAASEGIFDAGKKHPAKAVSDYAAFLWRTSSPKGRIAAFTAALQGTDVAERVRAADTLAKARDPQALETLIKLIEDPNFVARTGEERRAFLIALICIGGPLAEDCLKRQTARKTGLFHRQETEELRAIAAGALEELKARGATKVIKKPGGAP